MRCAIRLGGLEDDRRGSWWPRSWNVLWFPIPPTPVLCAIRVSIKSEQVLNQVHGRDHWAIFVRIGGLVFVGIDNHHPQGVVSGL